MTAPRDKQGRPIVVVTGMGIVTSLGIGKKDNWTKLTAGESGIKTVTRFPIDGLKSTMAGAIDFVTVEPFSSTSLARTIRNRQQGQFSGPAVSGGRAGRDRMAAAAGSRSRRRQKGIRLFRYSARQRWRQVRRISPSFHVRLGRRSSRRNLRNQGIADLIVHRLRLRRDLDPARRGSDPARRSRRGPVCRNRRHGQSGSHGPLLPALGAFDTKRSAAGRFKAVLEEPRRFRHGGRRRRIGAGKLRGGRCARRDDPRCGGRLRRADRFISPHPLEPRRQADHRLRAQGLGGCRHDGRADRPHQRARHRHAGKRQDGISGDLRRVRGTRQADSGVVEQVDGRPYHLGSGRGRSGVFAIDARTPADPANDQLRYPGSGDPVRRRRQYRARRARHRRDVEFVWLRWPEGL